MPPRDGGSGIRPGPRTAPGGGATGFIPVREGGWESCPAGEGGLLTPPPANAAPAPGPDRSSGRDTESGGGTAFMPVRDGGWDTCPGPPPGCDTAPSGKTGFMPVRDGGWETCPAACGFTPPRVAGPDVCPGPHRSGCGTGFAPVCGGIGPPPWCGIAGPPCAGRDCRGGIPPEPRGSAGVRPILPGSPGRTGNTGTIPDMDGGCAGSGCRAGAVGPVPVGAGSGPVCDTGCASGPGTGRWMFSGPVGRGVPGRCPGTFRPGGRIATVRFGWPIAEVGADSASADSGAGPSGDLSGDLSGDRRGAPATGLGGGTARVPISSGGIQTCAAGSDPDTRPARSASGSVHAGRAGLPGPAGSSPGPVTTARRTPPPWRPRRTRPTRSR